MSEKALEILKKVYESYSNNSDYTINTPPSAVIHSFNMAVKEIEEYIEFTRRDMIKIGMTLTDRGLEYCMENFD